MTESRVCGGLVCVWRALTIRDIVTKPGPRLRVDFSAVDFGCGCVGEWRAVFFFSCGFLQLYRHRLLPSPSSECPAYG